MYSRELWLTSLSDEELLALSPWTILTTENAKKFLITSGRSVLRKHARFGLSMMSNEELLHEVYPMLVEALPGILNTCVKRSIPENRDRFIYGCLSKLIRCRLADLVFGSNCPTERLYLEEITPHVAGDDEHPSSMPVAHSLMHPYVDQINSYMESQSAYQPQFLSESECVPEQDVQNRHTLIEQFRPYLTSREVDVLRCMLLNFEDRSLIALEVGTTPKQVSRYRQSIQKKMKAVLAELGWNETEIVDLVGKRTGVTPATA